MRYVHYGSDTFEPLRFETSSNRPFTRTLNKPLGGLWASPVGAGRGWKEWCEDEEYRLDKLETSFEFDLKPGARIIRIEEMDDIADGPLSEYFDSDLFIIDFDSLVKDGYDALEVLAGSNRDLYWKFYGWDCDSIVIFNADAVAV